MNRLLPAGRPARRSAGVRRALAPALAIVLVACTTVQTTKPGVIGVERSQRMSSLVSEQELEKGAEAAYAQILTEQEKAGKLNTDRQTTARVRAIAEQLIPQVTAFREDALNWDWQVNVIESDELNAWAMPGGKIAFYTGIIDTLQLTDGEIAAIMGHEIAHALREHSRERASDQALSQLVIGAGALGVGILTGIDPGGISQASQIVYQTTFGLTHSRSHETEADRIGVELAARAGFDPRDAINVWRKMAKATGGSSGPEFLSTHPSNETRIGDLQVYSEKVMPLYQGS